MSQDAAGSAEDPELTVIIVSFNTRELTLTAIRTLYENTKIPFHCVVFDNASEDGSPDAVEEAFPVVELIRSSENVGFAAANNIVAEASCTPWLLLLNPDTEVHEGAVDNLLRFSNEQPQAGITGGRTVFPDGSLNPSSCSNRPTLWSVFCLATGLTAAFRGSELFNPEGIGAWERDSKRHVDIVVGCFLMIPKHLWDKLGGFDLSYFMYGEETDLCLRAGKLGYKPMITPDAQIMHLVGASLGNRSVRKRLLVYKARATLMRRHANWLSAFLSVSLMKFGVVARLAACRITGRDPETWIALWANRDDWASGYPPDQSTSKRKPRHTKAG